MVASFCRIASVIDFHAMCASYDDFGHDKGCTSTFSTKFKD